jgi:hypothetical protein
MSTNLELWSRELIWRIDSFNYFKILNYYKYILFYTLLVSQISIYVIGKEHIRKL